MPESKPFYITIGNYLRGQCDDPDVSNELVGLYPVDLVEGKTR